MQSEKRKGKIFISYDVMEEIFQKICGDYLGKKVSISWIYFDDEINKFVAICEDQDLIRVAPGAEIPVIYEFKSRRNLGPTESFRRSRKISKVLNEMSIEKRVIPKRKRA